MIDLMHCFGGVPAHRVNTSLAVDMLRASRCGYLAVNTHSIDDVSGGNDLPVGYDEATLGSVLRAAGDELDLVPVLNINHPTSAEEAVTRARRAVDLTGIRVIKLEVLDDALTVSRNDEVVRATEQLIADGHEVWPLITADLASFDACQELGSAMVRVMGSPIGARRGIDADLLPVMSQLTAAGSVPVMLDGGIGSTLHAAQAYELGFDAILVNSCLFTAGSDPVAMLGDFRAVTDRAQQTGRARQTGQVAVATGSTGR